MKPKYLLLSYSLAFVGGIVLTILHSRENLFAGIVIAIGCAFLVTGVFMLAQLIVAWVRRSASASGNEVMTRAEQRTMARACAMFPVVLGCILLGIMLVARPEFFVHYIIYTFGAVMIMCGLVQLSSLVPDMSWLHMEWWWLITPLASLGIGMGVFIAGADKVEDIVALLTGIVLTVWSVAGFVSWIHRQARLRQIQMLNTH